MRILVRAIAPSVLLVAVLSATAAILAETTPVADGPDVDPHDQLRRILEQPIYRRWQLRQMRIETPVDSPWMQLVRERLESWAEAIDRLLTRLFRGAGRVNMPTPGDPSGFMAMLKAAGWMILIVLGVLLIVVAVHLLRRARNHAGGGRVLSREQVRHALDDGQALAMDSPRWLEQAERLAGERDFRAMYRALYLALLSGLHAAGRIEFRRQRTNWTYVSRFEGPEDARGVFADLTGLFDSVWYGRVTPAGADVDDVRRRVDLLLRAGDDDA